MKKVKVLKTFVSNPYGVFKKDSVLELQDLIANRYIQNGYFEEIVDEPQTPVEKAKPKKTRMKKAKPLNLEQEQA